jgi:hypothetical protein
MKKLYTSLNINTFILLLCFSLIANSQSQVTYTITFTGTWNSIDHSDNGNIPLPSNDHWSNLVGATHNTSVSFWNSGELASNGIENVAEAGNNNAFFLEVETQITANNANQWLEQTFNPNNATGTVTLMSITVDENFPLLTLVSMIAPSPDWFVGIHDLSLFDNNDNWIDSMSVDLFPYDAGTEDGNTYSTNNNATNPLQNISSLANVAPFNNQKIGTLMIIKDTALGINSPNQNPGIIAFPNPTSGQVTIVNPNHNLAKIQVYDVLGNVVVKHKNSTNKTNSIIDLTHLPVGVYVLEIIDPKGAKSIKKLIKK